MGDFACHGAASSTENESRPRSADPVQLRAQPGSNWYHSERISFPLSGCQGYAKHLSRTGAYRFFLGDVYAYGQSIRQTIEHGGERNSIATDYCSLTYLYSKRRPTANLAPPPLSERAVQDPQEIVFPAWRQTPIYAWSFELAEGKNNLVLKLVGKREKSSGLGLDLISVICVRIP